MTKKTKYKVVLRRKVVQTESMGFEVVAANATEARACADAVVRLHSWETLREFPSIRKFTPEKHVSYKAEITDPIESDSAPWQLPIASGNNRCTHCGRDVDGCTCRQVGR